MRREAANTIQEVPQKRDFFWVKKAADAKLDVAPLAVKPSSKNEASSYF